MGTRVAQRSKVLSDDLPSLSDVQKRVNKRYDDLFLMDKNGDRRPYVCSVCDEIAIKKSDMTSVTMTAMKKKTRPDCYIYIYIYMWRIPQRIPR